MKVIAIIGPTATGKSALAIDIAERYGGEIISCDSMQVYRGMDIGTAKPSRKERARVEHHLIDVINPNENFSCADYARIAKEAVRDIDSRGKIPIFAGGTGLYLDSVIEIDSFCADARDDGYRTELESYAKEYGAAALHKMLEAVDEESAAVIHENNIKRVIRALEIYKCTGTPKSVWDKKSKLAAPPYETTAIYLTYENRDLLYKKIGERVDKMISDGLLEEVIGLYESGLLGEEYTSGGAIGYKEFIPYIKGICTFEEAVSELKSATCHYAKRQMTWFGKKKKYHRIYVDKENVFKRACEILGGKNE